MVYWGQLAVALAAASGMAYTLYQADRTLGTALAVGVLAYIGLRWLFAWLFRTRYWIATGDRDWRRCGQCGQDIYRQAGDWILECKRCGWRPGWPGVRWVTQSVPAVQFRRTVAGPRAVVVVFVGFLLVTGVTAGVTAEGLAAEWAATQGAFSSDSGGGTATTPEPWVNETAIERQVFNFTNQYRIERGLAPVEYAPRLSAPAREHAQDMARHDFVGHRGSNGTTMTERYAGECSVPGENAGGTWYKRTFRTRKTDELVYLSNETEVARNLVGGWIRSIGHRLNMLNERWTELGVGIAVRDDGKVFAVQVFC